MLLNSLSPSRRTGVLHQKVGRANVAYSLRDWAKAYKEARVSTMLLIELHPDTCEADLSQALADLRVEVRRLSAGVFALAAEALPFSLLRKRLQQEGLVVREQPPRA